MNTNCINSKQYKYYTLISMLYSTLLIASVLLPYKIINFFGYAQPGGIFIFPLTYLLAGTIAETYGRDMAVKMIYASITCLLVFNITIAVIVRIPSAQSAPHQELYSAAFGSSIRLSIGCLIGLICSDLTNVYKITGLKFFYKGKYFIQRCLWSIGISEAIFNVLTYSITYYGVISNHEIYQLMINAWILKMFYSLVMIFPILFLMYLLKKLENIDIYDVKNEPYWLHPEIALLKALRSS